MIEGGEARVVIESISPQVDYGRFRAKRTVGEMVEVEADVFADGHDSVAALLVYRHAEDGVNEWHQAPMRALGNDRWRASFMAERAGTYHYTVCAWVDHLGTWQRDLVKRQAAGQDLSVDLQRGVQLIGAAAQRASGAPRTQLLAWADSLAQPSRSADERFATAQNATLLSLAQEHPEVALCVRHVPTLELEVSRPRARFSSWYEFFPRSASDEPGRHGTFKDCQARLPEIAAMGFDVVYLPPIHPIGQSHRKGPNNSTTAGPDDPGSPWAIGAAEGGHKALHPQLGSFQDFRDLVAQARALGMELALDVAFQCSPDHPYVSEHPEWFLKRPDGSIQYAENPPKKYQDIYPFDFECADWRGLWEELKSIFDFWIAHGVAIFRVDNPHTKPFGFWEWLIGEVRREHPDTIFLAEAFTRPKVMQRLAKLGFSQSYTYFAWRNNNRELQAYFTELSAAPMRDFFRPNLWPNTPDILTEHLQYGGRPAFTIRLILAATLGASYGVYGPAFELMEALPRDPGSEEYRDSEKYQLRRWDLRRPDSLRPLMTRLNAIRHEHSCLQTDRGLRFHGSDNESLLVFSKGGGAPGEVILVVANLDPHHVQSGWLQLDLAALGIEADTTFQAHDLLSEARYLWRGPRNYVVLDPNSVPAHVLRIRHRVRTEHDFDYFL